MKTAAALKKQAAKLADAAAEHRRLTREAEEIERADKLRPLVGKCFRYRNGYSSSEKWWLYAKVTGMTTGGYSQLEGVSFQDDTQGRLSIESRVGSLSFGIGNWQEITTQQYADARLLFLNKVQAVLMEVS